MTNMIKKLALSVAFPLIMFAALVPFPESSAQWEFAVLIFVSFWLMAWFGHLVLRALDPGGELAGNSLFLKACIGQFVLLLAWLAASPLLFVIKSLVDIPLMLPAVVALAVAATTARCRAAAGSFFQTPQYGDVGRLAFTFFAAACIYKIGAYYSVRAGALGLDTHQHIYFASDLYQAGYLKLNAGATAWIERYPKGLHAIAALWALPGFGDHIGSVLKVMPSLQALLALFSFIELCAIGLRRSNTRGWVVLAWWVLAAAGIAYILFRGTRFAYPVADLNSTARLSSAAVLLLPGIAGCMVLLHSSRRMAAFAGFVLPFAGAMALKFNPALALAFFAFSCPLWLLTAGWTIARMREARGAAFLGIASGTAIAVLLLATDPFYLGLMASAFDGFAAWLRATTGLIVLPELTPMGSTLSVSSLPSRMSTAFLREITAAGPGVLVNSVPDSTLVISNKLMSATRGMSWSVLVLWTVTELLKSKGASPRARGEWMPVLVQTGLLLGTWANLMAGRAMADVVGAATVEASVLSTYVREFSNILVLFLLPLHWALSGAILAQLLARFSSATERANVWLVPLAGASMAALAISLRWLPLPDAPRPETLGWWHPVKEAQLDAFQRLEQAVPADAVILADATAARLNAREEWVLPAGETAAYLSIARRRYLFNVRLGDGYALGFKDLDGNFCHGTPQSSRRFVERHDVGYLFAVDHAATTKQQVLDKTYCGIKYSDLGVIYPAVATGPDGMAIYKLKRE